MQSLPVDTICSKLNILKVKKGNKVLLESGKSRDIEAYVFGLTSDQIMAVPELLALIKADFSIQTIKEDLVEALKDQVKNSRAQDAQSSAWLEAEQFFPIHNASTNDILIFKASGGVSKLDAKVYAKRVGEDFETVYRRAPIAFVEYCPGNEESLFLRTNPQGLQEYIANTYVAPGWKNVTEFKTIVPPLFEKFFNHLFPIEEERKAVFHWMYWALVDRAQTVLCVPGIQGIGKTILGEKILSAMFGRENWTKAPRSFVSKEFNFFLKDRRIVLVEEIPTPRSREDRVFVNEMLKDITNDVVTIEGKGTNSEEIDNFANLIVTSNKLRAIPLENPIDRRFLCVSTPKNKLDTVFTPEEYSAFISSLTSVSDEMTQFCNWILTHGRIGKESAHYNLQNDIKYQIYRMSLTRWELTTLKSLDKEKEVKGGVFSEADMEGFVKKDKIKISTIEEFLDTFQMPSGSPIGNWDSKGYYVLSREAMSNDIYVNPKKIRRDIYLDDYTEDEDEEEKPKKVKEPKKTREEKEDDNDFFMKYGMSREEFEKENKPDPGLEAL